MPGIMVASAFGRTNPCCILCHRIDLMLMRRRPPEPGAVVMSIVVVPPEPEAIPMLAMAETHRFQTPEATQMAAIGTMAPAVDPPEAIPMPAMASVHSFHPPGAHLHRDAVNAEVDSDAIAGGLAVFQTISPRTQHEHESS